MIEMTIYGRGGQGGVTLAKLIATTYFLRDKHVQAFGVYAAERSGAPLQAFVRIDDKEITNHNQVRTPDHVIVLDRTLIAPRILTGLKPDGWIILNTPEPPSAYQELFAGRRVATIDATAIAVANGLGTRAVPIVNTTILGAVAHVMDIPLADTEAALEHIKFVGANITSARQSYEAIQTKHLAGELVVPATPAAVGAVPGILDEGLGEFPRIRTGDWATSEPLRRSLTPPCNDGCPAGNDVQGFIADMIKNDHTAALHRLLETSPFPGVCGRVCPAPCMEACNRGLHDDSINIRELERHAAAEGMRPKVRKPWRKERVAVIGSGPAGLSATYHLARLGYPVALFEAGSELGGLLRTGIPSYRLPRDVLDAEIDHILRHGVSVQKEVMIDRGKLLGLTRDCTAVFVASGLQETRSLNLGDLAAGMVEEGIDFLDRVCRGGESVEGLEVIVIGGGNTAMDAARSARRLGATKVTVVYRRSRAEMPAITEEIEEAIEEGIELSELVSPLTLRQDGVGTLLTCQRMILGEPDASGRPRPVPDTSEGSQFDLRCDRVILALGQSADLSILPEGSEIHDGKVLLGLSGAPIFAGGDFSSNDGTVTAAIGSGSKAALHIHQTLSGENLFPPAPEPLADKDKMVFHVFAKSPQQRSAEVSPHERRHSFTEVRTGYAADPDDSVAAKEAARCLSCGVCNSCDRCVVYCPEGIVVREDEGCYRFDYDYCKGCGICASQCPRGVIYMSEL